MVTQLVQPKILGLRTLRPWTPVMPAGAVFETIPRATELSLVSPASGDVRGVAVRMAAGITITSLAMVTLGTPLAAGTHQIFALHDSTAAYNQLAVTNDDTSAAWPANTAKVLNLTSPFITTYEGDYYFMYLIAAGTVPDLASMNSPVNSGVYALPPITHGRFATGATSIAATYAAPTALDRTPYGYGV